MKLLIGGKNLPGHEISINGEMDVTGQDLSGMGAVTADADTGVKPQEITVKTKIKIKDGHQLNFIYQLARAVDENGQRVVYTLVSDYTDAVNMRQGIFKGKVTAVQDPNLHRWLVTFRMKEYHSVPEKVEKQKQAETESQQSESATGQTSEGQEVAGEETTPAKQDKEYADYLYTLDNWLADEPQ